LPSSSIADKERKNVVTIVMCPNPKEMEAVKTAISTQGVAGLSPAQVNQRKVQDAMRRWRIEKLKLKSRFDDMEEWELDAEVKGFVERNERDTDDFYLLVKRVSCC
jgi:hypothetical protein